MNFTQVLLGVGALVALGKKKPAAVEPGGSGVALGPRGRQLVIAGAAQHAAVPVGSAASPSAGRADLPTAGTGKTLPIKMTPSAAITGGAPRSAEEGIKSAYAESAQIRSTIMLVAKTIQQVADLLKSFQALSTLLSNIAKVIATYAWVIAIAIEVVLEVVRGIITDDAKDKVINGQSELRWTCAVEQFVRNVNGVEQTLMYGRSELGLYASDWPDNEAGLLAARTIGVYYAAELDALFARSNYYFPQELWGVPVADAFGLYPGIIVTDFNTFRIEQADGMAGAFGPLSNRPLIQLQLGTSLAASAKYKIAAKNIAASGAAAVQGIWGRRWKGSILQFASQFDMVFDKAFQLSTPFLNQETWLRLTIGTPRRALPLVNTANDLDELATLSFGADGAEKLRGYGRALARGTFLAKGAMFFNRGIVTYLVYPGDEEFIQQFSKAFSNLVPTRMVACPGGVCLAFDGGRVDVIGSNQKLEPRFSLWR